MNGIFRKKEKISSREKTARRMVVRDYLEQYRKHPAWATVSIIGDSLGSLCDTFIPPLIVAELLNLFTRSGSVSFAAALPYLLVFTFVWSAGQLLTIMGSFYGTRIYIFGSTGLAKKAMDFLLEREYDFYLNNFVGTMIDRASNYSDGFAIFSETLSSFLQGMVFPVIFVSIVLWHYSPLLPVVLLFFVFLGVMVAIPLIRRRLKFTEEVSESAGIMAGHLSDTISNVMAVKSFAGEKKEQQRYLLALDDFQEKALRSNRFTLINYGGSMIVIYVLANVLGLALSVYLAELFHLPPGTVFLTFNYYAQISLIMYSANHIYKDFETSIVKASQFREMFLDSPTVQDIPDAQLLKITTGAVRFEDVNFSYGDGPDFISNLNLNIAPGEKIGLVGHSGSGKSTITKLLLRFMNPNSGKIFIDGQDICAVTQESLRNSIAYVPQDPALFHRSIRENIGYGGDEPDDYEIKQAAKLAHADEFIEKYEDGYDTEVGERGVKLSGGQRQRIAIAQAALRNARILIMDEATSALDSESEKYIQEGLRGIIRDRTAIIIAHRLSTVRHMDRILVLEEGKIVQDGTHEELLKNQSGIYFRLWNIQTGDEMTDGDKPEMISDGILP